MFRRAKLLLVLLLGLMAPASAQQAVVVPATMASVVFGSQQAITKAISGIAGKSIYITAYQLQPAATSVVTFSYGTGTNCGTGTTAFYGPATFIAGVFDRGGSGYGALFVVPVANDVCITITTANAPGSISYAQF